MLGSLKTYDVVILGGGNAGLCAAMAAGETGASVRVPEHAPKALRGGNSRHARNFRFMNDAPTELLQGIHREDEYWNDPARVGGGVDDGVARIMITESGRVIPGMNGRRARIESTQSSVMTGAARKTAFLLGGRKALRNAHYRTAERLNVAILYDTEVLSLRLDDRAAREVTVLHQGHQRTIRLKTVAIAFGSFQANVDWLKRYCGDAANHFFDKRHRLCKRTGPLPICSLKISRR